ncbi:uncharacterized protein LOC127862958 isoform X2 [Dreissena polymorpha]|uniref:uncharacterized protein LOC127862958 isoform X2 n=1 Tax=Dreissena polymorpha TaxID=45954 RepID=UPI00226565A1|nr:uncharacterized protein LOC127862958 isoform X2 [Dreissena polymorpha]
MNSKILFGFMAVHVNVISMLSKPLFHVNVPCATTVEVNCTDIDNAYGIWRFFKESLEKYGQNMLKVVFNETACSQVYLSTINTAQCKCLHRTGVTCTITDDNMVNIGDQWYCTKSTLSTGSTDFSNDVTLTIPDRLECTTTTLTTQIAKVESTMITNIDNETGTVTATAEMPSNAKKLGPEKSTKTESVIVNTTNSANSTEENKSEESIAKQNISVTQLAVIICGPFVLFVIGLVVLVFRKKLCSCSRGKHNLTMLNKENNSVEGNINVTIVSNNATSSNPTSSWMEPVSTHSEAGLNTKRQCAQHGDEQQDLGIEDCIDDDPSYSRVLDVATHRDAVNNAVAENDNATVQHNAIDANILQMPLQENTYVHYHEISEVSTVDINLAVDYQNIEIDIADIHERDGNLSTSTMKLGSIIQLLHMTENDPSTSWVGKPLQKDPLPIVFMALAEMTISDVDVTGSNILRADVEGACYENLDPESRDDKSQYTSLV